MRQERDINKTIETSALICQRYSFSAQIGKSALPDCAEKQAYLSFVDTCKSIVDLALNGEAV